jgi:hypothetical protein
MSTTNSTSTSRLERGIWNSNHPLCPPLYPPPARCFRPPYRVLQVWGHGRPWCGIPCRWCCRPGSPYSILDLCFDLNRCRRTRIPLLPLSPPIYLCYICYLCRHIHLLRSQAGRRRRARRTIYSASLACVPEMICSFSVIGGLRRVIIFTHAHAHPKLLLPCLLLSLPLPPLPLRRLAIPEYWPSRPRHKREHLTITNTRCTGLPTPWLRHVQTFSPSLVRPEVRCVMNVLALTLLLSNLFALLRGTRGRADRAKATPARLLLALVITSRA